MEASHPLWYVLVHPRDIALRRRHQLQMPLCSGNCFQSCQRVPRLASKPSTSNHQHFPIECLYRKRRQSRKASYRFLKYWVFWRVGLYLRSSLCTLKSPRSKRSVHLSGIRCLCIKRRNWLDYKSRLGRLLLYPRLVNTEQLSAVRKCGSYLQVGLRSTSVPTLYVGFYTRWLVPLSHKGLHQFFSWFLSNKIIVNSVIPRIYIDSKSTVNPDN